jgi:hypothetical protein
VAVTVHVHVQMPDCGSMRDKRVGTPRGVPNPRHPECLRECMMLCSRFHAALHGVYYRHDQPSTAGHIAPWLNRVASTLQLVPEAG